MEHFKPIVGEIVEALQVVRELAYEDMENEHFFIRSIKILLEEHSECQPFIDSDVAEQKKDLVLTTIAGALYREGLDWIATNRSTSG